MGADQPQRVRNWDKWWKQQLRRVRPRSGMKEGEVVDLAQRQGTALPSAYTAFLREAGRGCGDLWIGTDAFFPVLLDVRGWANELLAECESTVALLDEDVVIGMHQGYEFLILRGLGDDPPVLRFHEAEPGRLTRAAESFSSLVVAELRLGGT